MGKEAKIFYRKGELFRTLRNSGFTVEKKDHVHVMNLNDKRVVIGNINIWLFKLNPNNQQYERDYMYSIFDSDWLDALKDFIDS